MRHGVLCALLLTATSFVGTTFAQGLDAPSTKAMAPASADLILSNGKILTPRGWMPSVAIGNGVILAVGDDAAMRPHRTSRTRVIDLHGDTVFPGLNDAHVHVMWGGLQLTGVAKGINDLMSSKIASLTRAQRTAAIQAGLQEMLSYGVTSFNDALSEEEDMTIFAALADAGKLKQRVKVCIRWDGGAAKAAAEALIENRAHFSRKRITTDCVKLYTDGAPMMRTARMLEPYAGDPHTVGQWTIPPDQLKQLVQQFDARGFTLKIHGTGDGAARSSLDAIEAARKANGWSPQMHELAHNSFVAPEDLKRARSVGATLEFSPYIWYPTPFEDVATRATVGDERMERVHPAREAIEAGALVVGGSDWPFADSVSPWLGIETLVTRRTPGGGGHAVGEKEAITIEQALDMFTVNAAKELRARDKLGAIEPGLLADIVVLDRNPLQIPITQVHQTKAKLVFIEGEIVYDAAKPRS
jgi:predicted amidohydrolase YtcJ